MSIEKNWRIEPILTDDSSITANAIVNDSNTAIAINYTPYLERITPSLESIALSLESISNILDQQGGIPFKDIYAPLSYASLIKLFREQGDDIDALISETRNKLQGLE